VCRERDAAFALQASIQDQVKFWTRQRQAAETAAHTSAHGGVDGDAAAGAGGASAAALDLALHEGESLRIAFGGASRRGDHAVASTTPSSASSSLSGAPSMSGATPSGSGGFRLSKPPSAISSIAGPRPSPSSVATVATAAATAAPAAAVAAPDDDDAWNDFQSA
jgi:hypothetical protein